MSAGSTGGAGAAGPIVAYSERLGQVTDIEEALVTEFGATIRRVPLWSPDEVREHAADARIVLVGAVEPMDAAALAELRACELLVRRGVGIDNVDVPAATALGLPVAFVPDATVEEVSDHALALLLALERRIVALDRAVSRGDWSRDATVIAASRRGMRRLEELTLGIVGFGRIGQALARKAGSIFGTVVAFDPYATISAEAWPGVDQVDFEGLLERADLISLHAPRTPDNDHLFSSEAFARMRPGAYIVNTSRGGLIDEAALLEAVAAGRLAGAGLDVTEREPLPPDSPLLGEERILVTGHSAASSTSADRELRARAVDAARRALRGERPAAIADLSVFERPDCRLRLG